MEARRRKVAAVAVAVVLAAAARAGDPPARIEWRPLQIALDNHALCGKYLVVLFRGTASKDGFEKVERAFDGAGPELERMRRASIFCEVERRTPPLEAVLSRAAVAPGKAALVVVDRDGTKIDAAVADPTPERVLEALRAIAWDDAPGRGEGTFVVREAPRWELATPAGWRFADVTEDGAVLVADADGLRVEIGARVFERSLVDADAALAKHVESAFPGLAWTQADVAKNGKIFRKFTAGAIAGAIVGWHDDHVRPWVLSYAIVTGGNPAQASVECAAYWWRDLDRVLQSARSAAR